MIEEMATRIKIRKKSHIMIGARSTDRRTTNQRIETTVEIMITEIITAGTTIIEITTEIIIEMIIEIMTGITTTTTTTTTVIIIMRTEGHQLLLLLNPSTRDLSTKVITADRNHASDDCELYCSRL